MRDLLLAGIFGALLLRVFTHPETGVLMWAWVSIMNPHTLTFGFARSIPWAQITAIVALLAFVLSKVRKPFPWSAPTVLYVTLMLWMTVTSWLSINHPQDVWDRWIFVLKIHVMMFVTFMSLRGRVHIELLLWVVVLSIAAYGVKGGLWTILTGGSGRVWGPPGGMIQGNNEFAIAMTMMVPLMYYLHQTARWRWLRYALAFGMVTMAFAILGTQSRGALLALLAMAFMLGLKGKHPVRTSLAILCLVGLAILFMPESWSQRMDTIKGFREEGSAMSRVYTWVTLWNVAIDRPVQGAGFGIDNTELFLRYAPTDPEYAQFQGEAWVAHSIYFQALGEHGFVGLALYLGMGILTYRMAGRLAKQTAADAEFAAWVPLLMRMAQASLIGFAVGGAFLSLMHLDVTYYVMAMIVLSNATYRETVKARAQPPRRSATLDPSSPGSRTAVPS